MKISMKAVEIGEAPLPPLRSAALCAIANGTMNASQAAGKSMAIQLLELQGMIGKGKKA